MLPGCPLTPRPEDLRPPLLLTHRDVNQLICSTNQMVHKLMRVRLSVHPAASSIGSVCSMFWSCRRNTGNMQPGVNNYFIFAPYQKPGGGMPAYVRVRGDGYCGYNCTWCLPRTAPPPPPPARAAAAPSFGWPAHPTWW
jgi:hypothetical protein